MDNFPDAYYKHYLGGAVSGMFGILLSHPVDTIKTHLQTGRPFRSFVFNITNLYKGLKAPLLGVGVEKALVFGTYNYCRTGLNWDIPIAGAMAGLIASGIVSPYERWKILRQTGAVMESRVIWNVGFLYRGFSATLTREIPGFAIYFSIYESLKMKTEKMYNRRINYMESFIYGGMSGCGAWIFIYPQDRIKTILQSNSQGSISSIIGSIYKAGGLRHFYSGFSWAVVRALLLHSGTFCMMEIIQSF